MEATWVLSCPAVGKVLCPCWDEGLASKAVPGLPAPCLATPSVPSLLVGMSFGVVSQMVYW